MHPADGAGNPQAVMATGMACRAHHRPCYPLVALEKAASGDRTGMPLSTPRQLALIYRCSTRHPEYPSDPISR